jgi:hypothetical protein
VLKVGQVLRDPLPVVYATSRLIHAISSEVYVLGQSAVAALHDVELG